MMGSSCCCNGGGDIDEEFEAMMRIILMLEKASSEIEMEAHSPITAFTTRDGDGAIIFVLLLLVLLMTEVVVVVRNGFDEGETIKFVVPESTEQEIS